APRSAADSPPPGRSTRAASTGRRRRLRRTPPPPPDPPPVAPPAPRSPPVAQPSWRRSSQVRCHSLTALDSSITNSLVYELKPSPPQGRGPTHPALRPPDGA